MSGERWMQTNVWDLFHSHFKIGDDVFIIEWTDNSYAGKLISYDEEGCILRRVYKNESVRICWEDVRFMSHDGFPVMRLTGADGSKIIEKVDTSNMQQAMREIFDASMGRCGYCNKIVKRGHSCQVVFGDPFLVEDCSIDLYNRGSQSDGGHFDECLVLRAEDGAFAELYDLSTIYYFERGAA